MLDRLTQSESSERASLAESQKLRCDHDKPTCGRCLGRGLRTTCSYKSTPSNSRQNGATLDGTQAPFTLVEPQRISASNARNTLAAIARNKQGHDEFYGMFCDEPERSGPIQAGFLGPTSYSAISSEHQSQLDVDLGIGVGTPATKKTTSSPLSPAFPKIYVASISV